MDNNLSKNMNNSLLIEYEFDLFTNEVSFYRADFKAIKGNLQSSEIYFPMAFCLFLERNISKIKKIHEKELIKKLIKVSYLYKQKLLRDLSIKNVNEKLTLIFFVSLFVSKNEQLQIVSNYNFEEKSDFHRIDISKAVSDLILLLFIYGLKELPENITQYLCFYIEYGISKWERFGYPNSIINRINTWDFLKKDREEFFSEYLNNIEFLKKRKINF